MACSCFLISQLLYTLQCFVLPFIYRHKNILHTTTPLQAYKIGDIYAPFYPLYIDKMRKITKETANAFYNMQTCKKSNVCVDYGVNGHMYYYLHNNLIADYNPKEKTLTIMDAGRETNTTKERLNGILDVFGINAGIYQKNWSRYIGDEKRTGQKTFENC